ncbi:MAG: FAD/NAD(P)-binding protein, partial [Methylococcales bacterium]
SGSLLALQLTGRKNACEIILLEKDPQRLGRGVAYHYDFTHQPLNVIAAGMSLFPERPDHFVKWLEQNSFRYSHLLSSVSPKTFVPRKIFGDYILEHLEKAHHEYALSLQIRIDEVLAIERNSEKLRTTLESGIVLHADHVVLALGNFPPGDLFPGNEAVTKAPGYFANPWTDQVYAHITGNENILLVGTGLSAVDVVLGLSTRNFKGKVSMLSRSGKLPLPHDLSHPPVELEDPGYLNPRDAFFWLTGQIRKRRNIPWPAVIDGLRPLTPEIWKRWNWDERKYFLKRLRPIWEVVRHRIPARSAAVLSELESSGRLTIGKAKIAGAKMHPDGIEVFWSNDTGNYSGIFQKVINCTGPESDYRKLRLPVLANLIERGMMVNDPIGLGILCTPDGKILDKSSQPVNGLWCIGPMRKAVLWETTALRELRLQAKEIADMISA